MGTSTFVSFADRSQVPFATKQSLSIMVPALGIEAILWNRKQRRWAAEDKQSLDEMTRRFGSRDERQEVATLMYSLPAGKLVVARETIERLLADK